MSIDFENYISQLQKHLSTGDAREHTYRPAQVNFFDQFGVQTENDPARSAHGAPDYVFRNVKNTEIVLAYGEAKDIDGDLDKVEKTEQLDRYAGYNNFVLTNYIEFRFYRNGEKYETVEIAKRDGLALSSIPENFSKLADELTAFFAKPPEVIKNAKRLSAIMGAKARRIRRGIEYMLAGNAQDNTKATEISKVYGLMRELLVHDLEPEKFADMYAQTLVYGLFVARYNDDSPETFSRKEARDLVPASNPFLREFFDHIAGPRFEKGLSIVVDELCQVFEVSEVTNIIDRYLKLTGEDKDDAKDPIIHFYEDFLSEYDASVRKKMGAYYTPTPVVRYMVRAVDEVLKTHFGLSKGLADSSINSQKVELQGKKKVEQSFHRVQVLDPATGTGTFLNEIIKFVHEGFKGQEGLWPAYAKDSLIPRLHGFELMMGAYTIAHLKLGITLKNLGVEDIGSRVGVYLTNSLEEGVPTQPDLFSFGLADAVTHEAQEAAHIKSERPIMVVIGNPPYSVSSSNKGDHIQNLIKVYKKDLNERKINLDDDYIKFLRFSENLIEKNGSGVVAMITNNSFIDGITHRQMRKHLLETFDDIYILDLHGNSKRKETAPDGSKDENVFDIMQGVSINIFVKTVNSEKNTNANVYHSELFGKRKDKFQSLNEANFNNENFQKLKVEAPNFYFIPNDYKSQSEYNNGFSISDLFNEMNSGIQTKKDALAIQMDMNSLELIVDTFQESTIDELQTKYKIVDTSGWKVENAKKSLIEDPPLYIDICYRPFDKRKSFLQSKSGGFIGRPRFKTMHNMLKKNLALVITRQLSTFDFQHVLAVVDPIESGLISLQTKEWGYLAPLYLYDDQGNRSSNLDQNIVKDIKAKAPKASDETIFDYIYGVLHSPTYRDKYKEFLKIDFPRVPYPQDQKEFDRYAMLGAQLRELHLMTSSESEKIITTYPIAGNNIVEKPKFVTTDQSETGKVYINETQYFGGVPKIAWEFYIGGYQPAQKWLKDRKGRELSVQDLEHYQRIITVLSQTDTLMKQIG